MFQQLFHIPIINITIFSYGFMLVVAFIVAIEMGKRLGQRRGIDPEQMVTCGLIALVSGLAGARLCFVLENLWLFTRPEHGLWRNVFDAINIRGGGLTYYGGFLLATPCCIAYGISKHVSIRVGIDVVAPCLMVALGLGRIGCFLNGCCYGARSDNLPWAITFPYYSIPYTEQLMSGQIRDVPPDLRNGVGAPKSPDEIRAEGNAAALATMAVTRSLPVQPAQLYSAISAFLLCGLLLCFFDLPHVPGRVFALMLALEGINRFILELLRVEPPVWGRMTLSMILGLAICVAGIVLWWGLGVYGRRRAILTPEVG